MSLFIRHQLSPYCIPVWKTTNYRGVTYTAEVIEPAMHLSAVTPHGRNDYTDSPDD